MTQGQACYYGLRIGCPNATSANCRQCAERLTRAADQTLCSVTTNDEEASRGAGAPFGDDRNGHISDQSSILLSYSRERS